MAPAQPLTGPMNVAISLPRDELRPRESDTAALALAERSEKPASVRN